MLILGSTGSIGRQALEVIDRYPEYFELFGLASGSRVDALKAQVKQYQPRYAAIASEISRDQSRAFESEAGIPLWEGAAAMAELAAHHEVDIVLAAVVGVAGLAPVLSALRAGKHLALANKESVVCAGELVKRLASSTQAPVIPVDSEHSAIFQALQGSERKEIGRLTLTASGGPFFRATEEELWKVTPESAVRHPRWAMGAKISVDSATLMNKALELIEAHWLFDVPPADIEVLIHPQSIVHSLVCFRDGTQLGQLSIPDMRAPIAYALNWPERRLENVIAPLDLAAAGRLDFHQLDSVRFPAIPLARQCIQSGGVMPAVLNCANECAVRAFLKGRIMFPQIVEVCRRTLDGWQNSSYANLEELLEVQAAVERESERLIQGLKRWA